MKKFVITIGRQIGSGGKEIAERLARRLGVNVYDKKLIDVAARESGIDPAFFASADERESQHFLGGMFSIHGSMSDYITGSSYMQGDKLFEIQSEAIRNLAERESCVIVGRCAEYVLRDHPRMISIFITADSEERIKYIMKHDNVGRDKAMEIMEKGDKRRRQYHDFYATTRWGEARCYDLCINASHMGIEGTTEFLCNYIRQRLAL